MCVLVSSKKNRFQLVANRRFHELLRPSVVRLLALLTGPQPRSLRSPDELEANGTRWTTTFFDGVGVRAATGGHHRRSVV
jgi:hypothetical protein